MSTRNIIKSVAGFRGELQTRSDFDGTAVRRARFTKGVDTVTFDGYGDQGLFEFIATFDPEHVALMEAVVEAVAHADECGGSDNIDSILKAQDALIAYRRERGLL